MPFWRKKQPDLNVWQRVLDSGVQAIEDSDIDQPIKQAALAIVGGAVVAARRTFGGCELFRARGELRVGQAVAFVEVFAMAMVSRWVWSLCEQDDTLDRNAIWSLLSYNVLSLFGSYNDARYEEAWLMDMQFNADRDMWKKEGIRFVEANLTLSLAGRALGAPLDWRLTSPPIPLETTRDLIEAGYEPLASPVDVLVAFEAIEESAVIMLEEHKRLVKGL